MPEYEFIDSRGHSLEIYMTYSEYTEGGAIICAKCGEEMQRKYEPVPVNWGGLSPSAGARPIGVQNLLDSAPRRRDEFEREHEEHERRTAS